MKLFVLENDTVICSDCLEDHDTDRSPTDAIYGEVLYGTCAVCGDYAYKMSIRITNSVSGDELLSPQELSKIEEVH